MTYHVLQCDTVRIVAQQLIQGPRVGHEDIIFLRRKEMVMEVVRKVGMDVFRELGREVIREVIREVGQYSGEWEGKSMICIFGEG